jgi:phosphotransferase system HPr (HPr) family protein
MKKFQIAVTSETGLHARPASIFVQAAKKFDSQISIRNITTNSKVSDAKSILSVLVLGVEKNHQVEIEVNGKDEDQAKIYLTNLIKNGFRTTADNN